MSILGWTGIAVGWFILALWSEILQKRDERAKGLRGRYDHRIKD